MKYDRPYVNLYANKLLQYAYTYYKLSLQHTTRASNQLQRPHQAVESEVDGLLVRTKTEQ